MTVAFQAALQCRVTSMSCWQNQRLGTHTDCYRAQCVRLLTFHGIDLLPGLQQLAAQACQLVASTRPVGTPPGGGYIPRRIRRRHRRRSFGVHASAAAERHNLQRTRPEFRAVRRPCCASVTAVAVRSLPAPRAAADDVAPYRGLPALTGRISGPPVSSEYRSGAESILSAAQMRIWQAWHAMCGHRLEPKQWRGVLLVCSGASAHLPISAAIASWHAGDSGASIRRAAPRLWHAHEE